MRNTCSKSSHFWVAYLASLHYWVVYLWLHSFSILWWLWTVTYTGTEPYIAVGKHKVETWSGRPFSKVSAFIFRTGWSSRLCALCAVVFKKIRLLKMWALRLNRSELWISEIDMRWEWTHRRNLHQQHPSNPVHPPSKTGTSTSCVMTQSRAHKYVIDDLEKLILTISSTRYFTQHHWCRSNSSRMLLHK